MLEDIKTQALAPEDADPHKIDLTAESRAVALKAPAGNEGDVNISGTEAGLASPFILEPGDSISLDLKGSSIWYELATTTDKLHIINLTP